MGHLLLLYERPFMTEYIDSFAPNMDNNLVLTSGYANSFRLWDVEGERILYTVNVKNDDYIVWTPDCYFDGTEKGIRELIYIVYGNTVYSIADLLPHHRQRKLIQKRVQSVLKKK